MSDQPHVNQAIGHWLKIMMVFPLLFILWFGAYVWARLDATPQPEAQKFVGGKASDATPIFTPSAPVVQWWKAPSDVPTGEEGELIAYGKELIAHTSDYLSRSHGSVVKLTNGLNCQNCHLDAGTRIFGNNYSAVAATYPKFRGRSGSQVDVEMRVNDCVERSLDGAQGLPLESRELKAMVAYIKFLGKDVPKGEKPKGSGFAELPYLDRAANPEAGQVLYEQKCAVCHGKDGLGIKNSGKPGYQYPPLWGPESYNQGAGLYRLSRFASYIKSNMPFGVTHEAPQLSDEEAWDIAAFVNSQPHPSKDLSKDWPDISLKPVDHPFGPFADPYDEKQHKLGPFGPIAAHKKQQEAQKATK